MMLHGHFEHAAVGPSQDVGEVTSPRDRLVRA